MQACNWRLGCNILVNGCQHPKIRMLASKWARARAARGRAGLPPPGRRLVFCIYLVYAHLEANILILGCWQPLTRMLHPKIRMLHPKSTKIRMLHPKMGPTSWVQLQACLMTQRHILIGSDSKTIPADFGDHRMSHPARQQRVRLEL